MGFALREQDTTGYTDINKRYLVGGEVQTHRGSRYMKWKNFPIPEAYIVALIAGVVLHILFPQKCFAHAWIGHLAGWPLAGIGIALSLWAVREIKEMDIASPTELITGGPYSYSRNPMYVAWSLLYLGISLAANSLWFICLFPAVAIFMHFVSIRREEIKLEQLFGEKYVRYRNHVRRYMGVKGNS